MKMKQIMILCLLVAFSMTMGACTKVEPGYVGIKVHQYGDQRGVDDFPIITGRVWYNPLTYDIYKFPTFLQNEVWTADKVEGSPNDESITFNSQEGAFFNADVAVSYSLEGDSVPALFVEFRKSIDHITDVYMRSQVRAAFNEVASTMEAMEIVGPSKAEFNARVKKMLTDELGPRGFHFDLVEMTGKPRLDPKVEAAINQALQATQQAIAAENKVRQVEAEADQRREKAQGDADAIKILADQQAEANRVINESVTDRLIQWEATKRWDGKLPQVTGGAIPMIRVPNSD